MMMGERDAQNTFVGHSGKGYLLISVRHSEVLSSLLDEFLWAVDFQNSLATTHYDTTTLQVDIPWTVAVVQVFFS